MGRLLIQFPGTTTAKALTETLSKNVIIVDEDLHQLRLHDGSTAGGHLIGGSSGSGVPVGTIIPFAGNSIPQGYLLCDGSAISRTTYASLFAVIGTIYGAGDGNSTFNLPSLTDGRVVAGSTNSYLGTTTEGVAPNITGTYRVDYGRPTGYSDGAFYHAGGGPEIRGNTAAGNCGVGFDASRVSSLYVTGSTQIRAASLFVKMIIKYI